VKLWAAKVPESLRNWKSCRTVGTRAVRVLESSLAENALRVLLGTKLTMSQRCALAARRLRVPWAASAGGLAVGGGRWSFPPLSAGGATSGVLGSGAGLTGGRNPWREQ